jgi:hypothetical protein
MAHTSSDGEQNFSRHLPLPETTRGPGLTGGFPHNSFEVEISRVAGLDYL